MARKMSENTNTTIEKQISVRLILGPMVLVAILFCLFGGSESYIAPLSAAVLFHSSALVTGHMIFRTVFRTWSIHESWGYSWALGLAVHGFVGFGLAELSLYQAPVIWAYLLGILFFGYVFLTDLKTATIPLRLPNLWTLLTMIVVLAYLLFNCVPPTFYDATTYHVGLPMQYAFWGESIVTPHQIYSAFPLLAELSTGLIYLVTKSALFVNVAHAGMIVPLLMMVQKTAKHMFGNQEAAVAGFVFVSIPTIHFLVGGTKSDLLVYLFVAVILSLCASWESHDEETDLNAEMSKRYFLLLFLFGGLCLSAKLSSGVYVMAYVGLYLASSRSLIPKEKRIIVFGLMLAAVAASPFYIRNWFVLGNPTFPFLTSIFDGDSTGADFLTSQAVKVDGLQEVLSLWRLPYDVCFVNSDPTMINTFGGVVFFFLPVALLQRTFFYSQKRNCIYLLLTIPYWLSTYMLLRFHPFLVLLGTLWAARGVVRLCRLGQTGRFVVPCLVLFLVYENLSFSTQALNILLREPLSVHLDDTSHDDFLSHAQESYPAFKFLNETSKAHSVVYMMSDYRIAHLERRAVISGVNVKPAYAGIVKESSSGKDIIEQLKNTGANYLVFHGPTIQLLHERHLLDWDEEEEGRVREMLSLLGKPLFYENAYAVYALE